MPPYDLRAIYAFAREMYPKKSTAYVQYGTAGFRGKATELESVMYRMGILATLRSRSRFGQVVGVMVTASHNPEPDNGVKLIDPKGEMLDESWEKVATSLANVPDSELVEEVQKIIKEKNIDFKEFSLVYVGMDNRYHSPCLAKAVSDGVLVLKGNLNEQGIITTPMLHFFVCCANSRGEYGEASEKGYFTKLIRAFEELRGGVLEQGNYKNMLLFDGSNGIGGHKMLQCLKLMHKSLKVKVFNSGDGKINHNCGADFVKVQQKLPAGMPSHQPYTRCVSIDGDGDRLVYYFTDENDVFHLLDGDRIATLICSFLIDLVTTIGVELRMGIVQTAYANGASTEYIVNKLKVPVTCVPTGVKHLHNKAKDFDVGVYFEANGHGTVIFGPETRALVAEVEEYSSDYTHKRVANLLTKIIDLTNETVGDAISDMLLIETILHYKGWDVQDWLNTYTDLPNRQLKVLVKDRNVITTTDAERWCLTPAGLQEEINKLVVNYNKGRAFVRPSGTEDVVRVYAEAATQNETEDLAYEVGLLVYKMAGGIGAEPKHAHKTTAHM